jgi:hypothetical protein
VSPESGQRDDERIPGRNGKIPARIVFLPRTSPHCVYNPGRRPAHQSRVYTGPRIQTYRSLSILKDFSSFARSPEWMVNNG